MEYFLAKENASIWAQVQRLARSNDDAALQAHVKEAFRLTSSQRTMRVATQPAELEGKSIQPGDAIVLLIVSTILCPPLSTQPKTPC